MENERSQQRNVPLVLTFMVLFAGINALLFFAGRLKADWSGFGIIAAAGLTLSLYSFLYRDNPLFTFAEHLYVGVAAAYTFLQVWYPVIVIEVIEPLRNPPRQAGAWYFLKVAVPASLGLFLFLRFSRPLAYLSRISFAFIVGFTAGFAIPRYVTNYIFQQIAGTMQPLWAHGAFDVNALVVFTGVMTVLFYFFFSVEHKGAWGIASRVGVLFLMVSFGASFGYTVMARVSLLIGRITFLLQKWLGVGT